MKCEINTLNSPKDCRLGRPILIISLHTTTMLAVNRKAMKTVYEQTKASTSRPTSRSRASPNGEGKRL